MDRGSWGATVYGVTKSQTQLSDQAQHACTHTHTHTRTQCYHPDTSRSVCVCPSGVGRRDTQDMVRGLHLPSHLVLRNHHQRQDTHLEPLFLRNHLHCCEICTLHTPSQSGIRSGNKA